ncbi:MAG: catalase [Candidatus Rokuibacteriota bacterium]
MATKRPSPAKTTPPSRRAVPRAGSDRTKQEQLERHREDPADQLLTTNQGLPINDDQNSLKVGARGPSLLEDFILREKITHFDHERIPERVVHARGTAAHGHFQVYESLARYTRAAFLQDPSRKTPVFVRFSTVAGSRGSSDLARDVRGFAVKFYTDEGNFDLVGNNIPIFFIQDAVKFPDLIHAVKPEPHNEIPQAASAHDTFWDFVSVMPESMHMIMWAMSDRALPRSFRMMEGFGIHTFKLVDGKGAARFVKFHWKPRLGVHSVLWDEAVKISGKDPDFHRRDLWEAIEAGAYPEWELGLQIIPEADEDKFDFDLLDPTKIVPEELVPVERVGRLILDRNPDNFFAETEQVAFHPGHVVPGIDFTHDPLLQGRLFSYTDTQLTRLGGPNFHEIPINRPVSPLHNNQRDGLMRQAINLGRAAYHPNTIGGGCPMQAGRAMGGFVTHPQALDGQKVRERGKKFFDHFSQATLFWNSQSEAEKQHVVQAFRFELGKLERPAIRERVVAMLVEVDRTLAARVAEGLGLEVPAKPGGMLNHSVPADGDPKDFQPVRPKQKVTRSGALSMAGTVKDTVKTRRVAILAADGVDGAVVASLRQTLTAAGAVPRIVAPRGGALAAAGGGDVPVDFSLLTVGSVLFDAVFVPGGAASTEALGADADAVLFVREAYKHCKAVGGSGTGLDMLRAAGIDDAVGAIPEFMKAIAEHRDWGREERAQRIPA